MLARSKIIAITGCIIFRGGLDEFGLERWKVSVSLQAYQLCLICKHWTFILTSTAIIVAFQSIHSSPIDWIATLVISFLWRVLHRFYPRWRTPQHSTVTNVPDINGEYIVECEDIWVKVMLGHGVCQTEDFKWVAFMLYLYLLYCSAPDLFVYTWLKFTGINIMLISTICHLLKCHITSTDSNPFIWPVSLATTFLSY